MRFGATGVIVIKQNDVSYVYIKIPKCFFFKFRLLNQWTWKIIGTPSRRIAWYWNSSYTSWRSRWISNDSFIRSASVCILESVCLSDFLISHIPYKMWFEHSFFLNSIAITMCRLDGNITKKWRVFQTVKIEIQKPKTTPQLERRTREK